MATFRETVKKLIASRMQTNAARLLASNENSSLGLDNSLGQRSSDNSAVQMPDGSKYKVVVAGSPEVIDNTMFVNSTQAMQFNENPVQMYLDGAQAAFVILQNRGNGQYSVINLNNASIPSNYYYLDAATIAGIPGNPNNYPLTIQFTPSGKHILSSFDSGSTVVANLGLPGDFPFIDSIQTSMVQSGFAVNWNFQTISGRNVVGWQSLKTPQVVALNSSNLPVGLAPSGYPDAPTSPIGGISFIAEGSTQTFGLTYITNPYDTVNGPQVDLIGSSSNEFIAASNYSIGTGQFSVGVNSSTTSAIFSSLNGQAPNSTIVYSQTVVETPAPPRLVGLYEIVLSYNSSVSQTGLDWSIFPSSNSIFKCQNSDGSFSSADLKRNSSGSSYYFQESGDYLSITPAAGTFAEASPVPAVVTNLLDPLFPSQWIDQAVPYPSIYSTRQPLAIKAIAPTQFLTLSPNDLDPIPPLPNATIQVWNWDTVHNIPVAGTKFSGPAWNQIDYSVVDFAVVQG
jgi:hypothetical protein